MASELYSAPIRLRLVGNGVHTMERGSSSECLRPTDWASFIRELLLCTVCHTRRSSRIGFTPSHHSASCVLATTPSHSESISSSPSLNTATMIRELRNSSVTGGGALEEYGSGCITLGRKAMQTFGTISQVGLASSMMKMSEMVDVGRRECGMFLVETVDGTQSRLNVVRRIAPRCGTRRSRASSTTTSMT